VQDGGSVAGVKADPASAILIAALLAACVAERTPLDRLLLARSYAEWGDPIETCRSAGFNMVLPNYWGDARIICQGGAEVLVPVETRLRQIARTPNWLVTDWVESTSGDNLMRTMTIANCSSRRKVTLAHMRQRDDESVQLLLDWRSC
jgi:hypothetical protein